MRVLGGVFLAVGLAFLFLNNLVWSIVGPMFLGSTYANNIAFQRPPAGLAISGVTFILVGLVLFLVGFMGARSRSAGRQLMAVGIPGTATVLAAQDTGMTINDNPRVQLTLQVAAGGNNFQTNTAVTVPRIMIGKIAPGSVLVVKVDPAKPSNMVIDWQAVPGPG